MTFVKKEIARNTVHLNSMEMIYLFPCVIFRKYNNKTWMFMFSELNVFLKYLRCYLFTEPNAHDNANYFSIHSSSWKLRKANMLPVKLSNFMTILWTSRVRWIPSFNNVTYHLYYKRREISQKAKNFGYIKIWIVTSNIPS